MSTRSPRAGALRRTAARAGVVGALVVGLTGLGVTAASAHHPEIKAWSDCGGTVAFESTAWTWDGWEDDPNGVAKRTNPDIRIEYSADGGTTWTEITPGEDDEPFEYSEGNDFSFGGEFTPAAEVDSVLVRATADAPFANGRSQDSSRTTEEPVEVDDEPCVQPSAEPFAQAEGACDGFTATIANEGTAPVTFTVTRPDGGVEEHVAEAGSSQRLTYEPSAPGTTLTITAEGMRDVVAEAPSGCAEPTETAEPAEDAGDVEPVADDTQARTGESETLADTGVSSLGVLAAVAGGLLVAGGAVTLLARRRRAGAPGE